MSKTPSKNPEQISKIDPEFINLAEGQAIERLKQILAQYEKGEKKQNLSEKEIKKVQKNARLQAKEKEIQELLSQKADPLAEIEDVAKRGRLKQRRRELVQLSLIPNFAPAANVAIRSCLFTTRTGKREKNNEAYTEVACWHHKNISVAYKGEELRQDDLSLWIHLCKIAASNGSFRGKSTINDLLKAMKLKDSGQNRKKIKEILSRLHDGSLNIKFEGLRYYGVILPEYVVDEDDNTFHFSLLETISKLLGIHDFSMLNEETRNKLPGATAQWFHAFVNSHEGPVVEIPWQTIHELSGSKAVFNEEFKRTFRKSVIMPLKEIGFIDSVKSVEEKLIVSFNKEKP
jgi:hypothetical protein